MSYVNSYDTATIDSIKEIADSYGENRNISQKVKDILSSESISILDKIENGNEDYFDSFDDVINDYFDCLNFKNGNYNDAEIQRRKNDIGLFFQYVDTLNISDCVKEKMVHSFFERFSSKIRESRGFYQLITLDLISNSKIINNYLNDGNFDLNKYALFTKKLYKILDNFDDLQKEKINYLFNSSYECLIRFIESYNKDIEFYFPKTLINNLTKEELSLIYRVCDLDDYSMFFKDNKFLKMIMIMKDYVLRKTGRSAEFLDKVLLVFSAFDKELINSYVKAFKDYYDRYLEKANGNFENDEIFNQLLLFTMNCCDDLTNLSSKLSNLEMFSDNFQLENKLIYTEALSYGRIDYLKLCLGVLEYKDNLFNISNNVAVKAAYFDFFYGINYSQAEYIVNKYGMFLEDCKEELCCVDRDVYNILSDICNVYNMKFNDEETTTSFQKKFFNGLKEKWSSKKTDGLAFVTLRSRLDDVYTKSFNDVLFKKEDGLEIDRVNGVPIIDAGVNFNMIVNATTGVGDFFDAVASDFNLRYNSTDSSDNQGLCTSFINNENLGVLSLNGPLLGYDMILDSQIHAMGYGDIYSDTQAISLKNNNFSIGEGRVFLTPKVLIDYSRFGYNEIVLERFLKHDENNQLKIQPSYIVVYKMDDDYKETPMFRRGLMMANDFGIPIVVVDVMKVKENEKNIIAEMEDVLFSRNEVNKELMLKIFTRYMNNHTGSLILIGTVYEFVNEWNYEKDFSSDGIYLFFRKLSNHLEKLSFSEILEWKYALINCYHAEKEKNTLATEITSYGCSISRGEFYLKEIEFLEMVDEITNKAIGNSLYNNGMIDKKKNVRAAKNVHVRSLINLANFLVPYSFVQADVGSYVKVYQTEKNNELTEEERQVYGLVVSYLFGNYKINCFDSDYVEKISCFEFNFNKDIDFESLVKKSIYADINYDSLLLKFAILIENIDVTDMYSLFEPIIKKYSDKSALIMDIIYHRSRNIYNDFTKLVNCDKVNIKKLGEKK